MKRLLILGLALGLTATAFAAKNSYKKANRNRITMLTEGKTDAVIKDSRRLGLG